jgi:TonB family protein
LVLQATQGTSTVAEVLCRTALRSSEARMRGAAARLALSLGVTSLLPDLAAVLAVETDGTALAEEVRAAVLLGSDREIGAALGAVTRSRAAAAVLIDALTVAHPDKLVALVPAIGALDVPHELGAACWKATRLLGDPEARAALAESALGQGLAAWSAFLDAAADDGRAVADVALLKAVTGPDPTLLVPTIVRLTALAAAPSPVLPEPGVLDALDRHLSATGMPGSAAVFAREVLDRAVRGKATTTVKWAPAIAGWPAPSLADLAPLGTDVVARFLTSAEKKALAARCAAFSGRPTSGLRQEVPRRVAAALATQDQPQAMTRTLGAVPAGVIESIMGPAGCTPSAGVRGLASVTFGANAVITEVHLNARLMSPGCERAFRALAGVVLPDPLVSSGTLAILRADFHPEVLACAHSQPSLSIRVERTDDRPASDRCRRGGTVEPPRKLVNEPPVYPQTMLDARRQGVVVLEATISETGCISRLTVTRSAGVAFDVAAIDAVVRWRFTPTLLNGKAVPVIMTTTVNFSLK